MNSVYGTSIPLLPVLAEGLILLSLIPKSRHGACLLSGLVMTTGVR